MAQTPFLGLTQNDADGWKYSGKEISFLHGVVESQLIGALLAIGGGIVTTTYGENSFKVTAGTGLNVSIAPGSGLIVVTGGACAIERAAAFTLPVPASSTSYVHAVMEISANNDSRKTRLPLLIISAAPVEPNAQALAQVVTGANSVTAVIDLRRKVSAQRYDPATPANWVGVAPATVAQALDRLAAALKVSTGAPIP